MTFIQPHKQKNRWNSVLICLAVLVILGTFWLVLIYNKVVSLNHGISTAEQATKKVQTESAELKDRAFALSDGNYLQNFAKEKNLVEDKNPQYFEVNPQWENPPFASLY